MSMFPCYYFFFLSVHKTTEYIFLIIDHIRVQSKSMLLFGFPSLSFLKSYVDVI